jgi:ATP-dependent DNA helicase RecG
VPAPENAPFRKGGEMIPMQARPKLEPRELMQLAIEVMRQSLHEPRSDGKASPLVGTALWRPDGTVDTACRGELRYGDHAEYTLLERKNRSNRLDGCRLFATLEPCSPGSRRHPKLSCAERIVLARIREVWVGIEDPDPMVDRKGIKYLQDSGVTVHMFDRDLQEEIREANRKFIDQALERAAAAREEKPSRVTALSPLENPPAAADRSDLAIEALEQYRVVARIKERVTSAGFDRRLLQQGLLKDEAGRAVPTGFGLLLFGREPRTVMPQAGLLGTIHFPDGSEEPKDFDGPQVLAPEQALHWLKDKLPNPIERSAARRRPVHETLFELVREGVVNAIVHRDYSIRGAKCQLVVTPDTIAVKSPGRPVEPVTLEQMQSFDAPMLSRNPVLHYVFARMELAEERGLGLKSMKARTEAAGLPLPRYTWEDPYLVLTLYRSSAAAVNTLIPEVLGRLSADERASWEYVAGRELVTRAMLMAQMGFDERKAQRILKKLQDAGLLRRVGQGPATSYEAVRA